MPIILTLKRELPLEGQEVIVAAVEALVVVVVVVVWAVVAVSVMVLVAVSVAVPVTTPHPTSLRHHCQEANQHSTSGRRK